MKWDNVYVPFSSGVVDKGDAWPTIVIITSRKWVLLNRNPAQILRVDFPVSKGEDDDEGRNYLPSTGVVQSVIQCL